ncbi:MAG: UDP-N-acetylmuramoyl-L-alanine--D-glutamate ligase [Clostridia bacterium]|nr:UDP-N-acetylmuramoyl-L-alanine--D-glutamate ligase [Clostridia bacterium]MBP3360228.1 UDP-N-acetylmuramoyl-L-alanine--D-glutamate ligase [Clostridia bacterium]
MNLNEFKNTVYDKNISVIGLGISNRPLIKYLVKLGANVTAYDKRTKEQLGEIYDEFSALGVKLITGESYLDDLGGEIIFKTPGLRFDHPALLAAKEKGSIITSEMEVFFDICPAHIIAVTGSDGKTTTTTLIHKMMTQQGYKTWLGGNIGNPLLTETEQMSENDWVILELSSFQLHTMRKSPEIAVITNLSPNHLDVHKDYAEYIDAKKNIMLYQNGTSKLVVNASNEETAKIGKEAKGTCVDFSSKEKAYVCLENGQIMREGKAVLDISKIKIPGMHNVENYMAAIAAVEGLVDDAVIAEVARTFGGVPHRIELVRTVNGVRYYNSSIDSSPNRSINTLKVFEDKVIMIAGGKDKGIPYDEIGPAICEKVKILILIGKTAEKIEQAVMKAGGNNYLQIIHCDSYESVVKTAHDMAKSGDVVLLSPASTSFDMFSNFEERGNLFRSLVCEL